MTNETATNVLSRAMRFPKLGRRMFFRHLATALSGYFFLPSRPGETLARAASAPVGTAKNVIFVFMTGAPSHTDTFDLKEGETLYRVRVGSFSDRTAAAAVAQELQAKGYRPFIARGSQ